MGTANSSAAAFNHSSSTLEASWDPARPVPVLFRFPQWRNPKLEVIPDPEVPQPKNVTPPDAVHEEHAESDEDASEAATKRDLGCNAWELVTPGTTYVVRYRLPDGSLLQAADMLPFSSAEVHKKDDESSPAASKESSMPPATSHSGAEPMEAHSGVATGSADASMTGAEADGTPAPSHPQPPTAEEAELERDADDEEQAVEAAGVGGDGKPSPADGDGEQEREEHVGEPVVDTPGEGQAERNPGDLPAVVGEEGDHADEEVAADPAAIALQAKLDEAERAVPWTRMRVELGLEILPGYWDCVGKNGAMKGIFTSEERQVAHSERMLLADGGSQMSTMLELAAPRKEAAVLSRMERAAEALDVPFQTLYGDLEAVKARLTSARGERLTDGSSSIGNKKGNQPATNPKGQQVRPSPDSLASLEALVASDASQWASDRTRLREFLKSDRKMRSVVFHAEVEKMVDETATVVQSDGADDGQQRLVLAVDRGVVAPCELASYDSAAGAPEGAPPTSVSVRWLPTAHSARSEPDQLAFTEEAIVVEANTSSTRDEEPLVFSSLQRPTVLGALPPPAPTRLLCVGQPVVFFRTPSVESTTSGEENSSGSVLPLSVRGHVRDVDDSSAGVQVSIEDDLGVVHTVLREQVWLRWRPEAFATQGVGLLPRFVPLYFCWTPTPEVLAEIDALGEAARVELSVWRLGAKRPTLDEIQLKRWDPPVPPPLSPSSTELRSNATPPSVALSSTQQGPVGQEDSVAPPPPLTTCFKMQQSMFLLADRHYGFRIRRGIAKVAASEEDAGSGGGDTMENVVVVTSKGAKAATPAAFEVLKVAPRLVYE